METVDVNVSGGRGQVQEPTVWRLIKDFDVRVNIKKASVDEDYGWLQLELQGPVEEIQRATAWLMTTGLHVEALRRAVGA
ncbi:FeS-binding protein [bacterium]|nr:MAG: FeS-binding protein [bacterium]